MLLTPDPSPQTTRAVLIGAGRVGTAVGELVRRAGGQIAGVSSRSRASAEAAGARLHAPVFDFRDGFPDADFVLIGAPEAAIGDVVEAIADHVVAGARLCHFAGAVGLAPLAPALRRKARGFALHPVQACPDVETALRRLPGSVWGVTCDEQERDWAESFIRSLAGEPRWVDESDRPIWHAAAVSVSNTLAALVERGEAMLGSIGIEDPGDVLGPLASGTLQNVREADGATALTGPVVRGEADALARHLRALEARDVRLADSYRLLARVVIDAAAGSGRIEPATEQAMLRVTGSQ